MDIHNCMYCPRVCGRTRIHAPNTVLYIVGGRTRLVKDITREHGASDFVITRIYLRVSTGVRPNALAFQDLDAYYAAAWRDALVKELRAYKAAADHCFIVVLQRRFDEAHCYRLMKGAKTHHKVRAHRAWRRNAERMAHNWALSL